MKGTVFSGRLTVYYLPWTTGWGATFADRPTAVWPSGLEFTANPTTGPVGLTIQFNCPSVDDGNNDITNWNWDFGDGSTSTDQNPTHAYASAGSFTPILMAVNSLGKLFPGSGPSITASPPPFIASFSFTGTNLVIHGANGVSGLTYYVLTSTNLVLPLSQWTPVAINAWNADGNFSLTVTNAVDQFVPGQFFILQVP